MFLIFICNQDSTVGLRKLGGSWFGRAKTSKELQSKAAKLKNHL
jgi:hypothetical protein